VKDRWLALAARFAALEKRERLLIAAVVLVGIPLIGYSLWIEPAQMRARNLSKQIEAKRAELTQLGLQVTTMQADRRDPDAPNKAALAEIDDRMATRAEELRRFDALLISPERMPALLQVLLARHKGLTLTGLRTLSPTPLIPPPEKSEKTKSESGKEAGKDTAPDSTGDNIYKHGIEVRIVGGYGELLGWLAELEASPHRLIWGEIKLVAEWPRSELTLTLYTLSLDEKWLVL